MSKSDKRHQEQRPDPPDPDHAPSPLNTALITVLGLLLLAAILALRLLRFLK